MGLINKMKTSLMLRYHFYFNKLIALTQGVNSMTYWNARFKSNWERNNGRLQTALFATAFVLLDEQFGQIIDILDYGCGCGDSLPVLKMKYPQSNLYYYDFSPEAMSKTKKFYSTIAQPLDSLSVDSRTFDLVYCSNVVEHLSEPHKLCKKLINLSNKYIVIQAPYNQRKKDGSLLSDSNNEDEHILTVTENFISEFTDMVEWNIKFATAYFAWPHGKQIFFIGRKKEI